MIELIDNKIELVFEKPGWLHKMNLLKDSQAAAPGREDLYHLPQSRLEIHEDRFNVLTHALGILFSLAALFWAGVQFLKTGFTASNVSAGIFSFSLVLVYGSSTLYHSLYRTFMKKFLQKIDHVMIFILIAGSFTPFTLVCLEGTLGTLLFYLIWILAIVGISLKLAIREDRTVFFTTYYLVMGWVGVVAIFPLAEVISTFSLVNLLAGGLFYTVGVVFFSWSRLKFNHGIWHLFVMAGSACHTLAVYSALY